MHRPAHDRILLFFQYCQVSVLFYRRQFRFQMTKITSKVHSIEDLDHPFPGLRIVPYIVEEEEHANDLTLIVASFQSYQSFSHI